MRASVNPEDFAGKTNSRSRIDQTNPRASRAISAQPVNAKIIIKRKAALTGGSSSGNAARAARISISVGSDIIASKMDYDQFLEQAREFQKNYDEKKLDKFWADIINAGLSHPFPIWRVSEILKWVDEGQFKELMEKK